MSRGAGDARLEGFLCFAVYSANLAFGKTYRTLLEPFSLTYAQYAVLVALWDEDGQSVGSIGARTCLASNTLTPVVKRLEGLGHVERLRSADDERIVHVRLTSSGRDLERRLADIPDCVAAATGFSDAALERLTADVVGVRDALLAGRRPQRRTSATGGSRSPAAAPGRGAVRRQRPKRTGAGS